MSTVFKETINQDRTKKIMSVSFWQQVFVENTMVKLHIGSSLRKKKNEIIKYNILKYNGS